MTFEQLYELLQRRSKDLPEGSYIASLLKNGRDRLVQKIGEEAVEVVIAGKNADRKEVVSESVDLLYHLFVLWALLDIPMEDIFKKMEERNKNRA